MAVTHPARKRITGSNPVAPASLFYQWSISPAWSGRSPVTGKIMGSNPIWTAKFRFFKEHAVRRVHGNRMRTEGSQSPSGRYTVPTVPLKMVL